MTPASPVRAGASCDAAPGAVLNQAPDPALNPAPFLPLLLKRLRRYLAVGFAGGVGAAVGAVCDGQQRVRGLSKSAPKNVYLLHGALIARI